jgi:hypothetical protein
MGDETMAKIDASDMERFNTVLGDVQRALKAIDDEIIAQWVAGIDGKLKAMRDAWEQCGNTREDRVGIYYKLYSICGGKSAYHDIYWGRSREMIEERLRKIHAGNIDARNFKIVSKLLPLGVSTVEIGDAMGSTHSGFSGWYVLNTDSGKYRLTIEVITAGGYNIQCLHYRTLVHVKAM